MCNVVVVWASVRLEYNQLSTSVGAQEGTQQATTQGNGDVEDNREGESGARSLVLPAGGGGVFGRV